MNDAKIYQIFARFRQLNPHPTTELKYSSPFELLIAVILSAQATDLSVNKACAQLFAQANTPEQILALGEDKLKNYIQAIGLYNSKAHHIIMTCEILIAKYQGKIPGNRSELELLPGVGRKTANVILNTIFHQPTIAVDTHIFRLANRINLVHAKTPLAVEKKLLEIIPQEFILNAHHWLILHGRYICTAKNPRCSQCPINDLCEYQYKNI